jgi:hypothetical protein
MVHGMSSSQIEGSPMATATTKTGPAAGPKAATEYLDTMKTQFTSAVKQSQQLVLDSIGSWTEAAAKLAPSMPAMPSLPSLPFVPSSTEVVEYVSAGFDIASELLANQREFATALLAKLTPPA